MTNSIKLALAGLVLFFAATSLADVRPQYRARRFIFLVHGLSGSEKTFGYLPEALMNHAKVIQPTEDVRVIPLSYETGSKGSTYHFAADVADSMAEKIGQLQPTDRITLVAHSQGGLISWIWYLLSLNNKVEEFQKYHQMAVQTEGIMTLGSPIWGSKWASFMGTDGILTFLAESVGGMGQMELHEMAFGSDTIFRFRDKAVQLDSANIKLPLRLQAVGGVLYRHDDPLATTSESIGLKFAEARYGAGVGYRAETDGAVTVPAARFDFIYLKQGKAKEKIIRAQDFTNFNFKEAGNFKVVEAPHASAGYAKIYDMAEVPSTCQDLANPCTHPTFPLILEFTLACTKEVVDCNQEKYEQLVTKYKKTDNWKKRVSPPELEINNLKSMSLDIVANLPKNFTPPHVLNISRFVQFPVRMQDRIYHYSDRSYFFRVNRGIEFQSSTMRSVKYAVSAYDRPVNQLRFTLQGHIYQANPQDPVQAELYKKTLATTGFKLPILIKIPGFKDRQIEVMVKPTYSTYIDLDYRSEQYDPALDFTPISGPQRLAPYM
jgi:pimeloyl-ACP methyl ester carboxylesterase